MATKSEDERHDDIVAAVLAAGIVQKQFLSGGGSVSPDAAYIVNLHRQVLAEMRKP